MGLEMQETPFSVARVEAGSHRGVEGLCNHDESPHVYSNSWGFKGRRSMSMVNWLQVTWGCLAEAVPETDMGQAGGGAPQWQGMGRRAEGWLPWSTCPGQAQFQVFRTPSSAALLHPGWEASQA